MPGLVPRRRGRPQDDESEESDRDASRATGKRARLGPSSNSQASEAPVLPESYRTSSLANDMNEQGPASSLVNHQPGSIVRVTLHNFVTYSAAEFHPGPSLNMVIGPNGTGKSTLVCAICMGLGWKTEVLGRAKDAREFIKHGAREATIEIELAADPSRHRSNPVVKRQIRRTETNKSIWSIDGKATSQKAVLELCRSFSIQVDNLCQFLPQDRVVEFAALSPVDLLAQTQRAAAPEHMIGWHEELKAMRKDQRKSQEDEKALTESLKNLEGRQNLQHADVQRLRERAELQERVAAMHRLRPFPLYKAARAQFHEAKEKKELAQQELNNLEREVEPALHAVNTKHDYVKSIERFVEQRMRVVERSEKEVKNLFKKQETLVAKIKECDQEITAEQDTGKKHKQERIRVETQIRDVKRQIENSRPAEFDVTAYNAQVREIVRQIREKEDQAAESNRQQDELKGQLSSRGQRAEKARADVENLRSKAGQQTNRLRQISPDTATAWDWIQKNRDRFSGPVFGPPMIECSVKDQKYANIVESMLNKADLRAITVTSREDFQLLNHQLYSDMKLSDINLRTVERPLSTWKPPVPFDALHALGLDTYVLDLIDGPDEVLSMLCDNNNIHAAGVAYRDISSEQYDAIARSVVSSWATPSETYLISRRREYGDKATVTKTQRIQGAKFFTSQPVDTRAEERLKNTIRELEGEMQEIRKEADAILAENLRRGDEHKALRRQKEDMEREKDGRQKNWSEWNKLPTKLNALERRLETIEEAASTYRARVQGIKERQEKLTLDRAREALKIVPSVSTLQKMNMELFDAELMLIEAESDHEILALRNREVREMLDARRVEIADLGRNCAELKTAAQQFQRQCNAILSNITPKEEEIFHELAENQTPEEFEIEIESTTARLDMVHEGNPHIIREYEERGKQIEKHKGKLERLKGQLTELETQIVAVRQQWEPELDALVAQISDAFGDNFSRIGCAGQVQVYKDEDFENWAIQVQVKFREHEQLSILDSHRQSGGERAVSTIFYLMALQSLARAPFRVVDEINQGMDPRNERLVHSRIVDIACAQHTSQYFLITPKLLPNLAYHPNMRVHCIASGEYMPEDHSQLNFQALAAKALSLRARV
ncbi:hypothetical protein MBLNU459_g1837t1 [Dothideomycetes sp. NU459]